MRRLALILISLLIGLMPTQATEWRGLFIAGDDSIAVFDNSQATLVEMLTARGLVGAERFTATRALAKADRAVKLVTDANLTDLEHSHLVEPGQGCIVHMTSHGYPGEGFYLSMDGGTYLGPDYVADLVTQLCGDAPTVVLISACYSGQFITDAMKAPNRVILTAASADRPSFGCSASETYTYWDGCLIEQLPAAKTWGRLYDNIAACITQKEAAIGAEPSLPQAYFGGDSRNWRILR